MKQKDLAAIIVVAIISGTLSFLLSNKLFVRPESRQQQVEVVDKISTEFTLPDERFFNAQSVNPTPATSFGDSNNQNPFSGNGN